MNNYDPLIVPDVSLWFSSQCIFCQALPPALCQRPSGLWQLFHSRPDGKRERRGQTLGLNAVSPRMKCLPSTWFSHGLLFGFSLWLLITGTGVRFLCVYFKAKQATIKYWLFISSSRRFLPLANRFSRPAIKISINPWIFSKTFQICLFYHDWK